jgi:hypothetical protein
MDEDRNRLGQMRNDSRGKKSPEDLDFFRAFPHLHGD